MFWSGFPRAILVKCISREVELILSEEIIEELKEILRREEKFNVTSHDISAIIKILLTSAKVVTPQHRLRLITKDKKDNKILECGIAGKVDYIVTGDKHLLQIKEYKGVKIVTPREIVEMVE